MSGRGDKSLVSGVFLQLDLLCFHGRAVTRLESSFGAATVTVAPINFAVASYAQYAWPISVNSHLRPFVMGVVILERLFRLKLRNRRSEALCL